MNEGGETKFFAKSPNKKYKKFYMIKNAFWIF